MTVNKPTNNDSQGLPYMNIFKLIGDIWILAIIAYLEESALRFGELQRAIGGINPVTLTNRLRRLEDAALINRTTESHDRQSVVYSLTDRGRRLLPVINAIKDAATYLR